MEKKDTCYLQCHCCNEVVGEVYYVGSNIFDIKFKNLHYTNYGGHDKDGYLCKKCRFMKREKSEIE